MQTLWQQHFQIAERLAKVPGSAFLSLSKQYSFCIVQTSPQQCFQLSAQQHPGISELTLKEMEQSSSKHYTNQTSWKISILQAAFMDLRIKIPAIAACFLMLFTSFSSSPSEYILIFFPLDNLHKTHIISTAHLLLDYWIYNVASNNTFSERNHTVAGRICRVATCYSLLSGFTKHGIWE